MLPIVGGTLGLSVIVIIVILLIIIVTSVSKFRARGTSLALPPSTSDEEEDIEMKPNSVYDLRSTNASEHIVTKQNEVYGVTLPVELSHEQTFNYVNP